MTTIALDTYKIITTLQSKGFSKSQAEALVEAVQENVQNFGFATKNDINELEHKLGKKISEVQIGIIKWITAALIAQAGLIVALLQLFA